MTTPSFHHFCLVSDQLVPNYLPVFHPDLRADKVTLAVTDSMKKKGEDLDKILQGHGIHQVEILSLGSDAAAFNDLQQHFIGWVDAHLDENVILNVTGGTKPMAIAAQEVFRMAGKPVFYVDITNDHIWLLDAASNDKGNSWRVLAPPLYDKLKLADYVGLYGLAIHSCTEVTPAPEWSNMAKCFAQNALDWQDSITLLNDIAQRAENANTLYPDPKELEHKFQAWDSTLKALRKHGLLVLNEAKGKWRFASEDARSFVKGGWLESYIFENIRGFYPNKGMSCLNVEFTPAKKIRNEIDVLVVAKGSLFAFECKTRNFNKKDSATDAIYKLDSLKEKIGGLRATGIIVSYRPLNANDRARVGNYQLKYIGPEDLQPAKIQVKLQSILGLSR